MTSEFGTQSMLGLVIAWFEDLEKQLAKAFSNKCCSKIVFNTGTTYFKRQLVFVAGASRDDRKKPQESLPLSPRTLSLS